MIQHDEATPVAEKTVPMEPPVDLLSVAERDDPDAAYRLGKLYCESAVPDHVKALYWMRRGVELGSPGALNGLGFLYLNGFGVESDPKKAVDLFRQAVEKEIPNAFYNLGNCYLNGSGVAKNTREGWRLMEQGAERGNPFAIHALAPVCMGSRSKQKQEKMFQYLRAVESMHQPVMMYCLASCYLFGLGTRRNDVEAIRVIRSAQSPSLDYLLGWCYQQGRGVEKNLEEANRLFRSAAEAGMPESQFQWGYNLQAGVGVPRNRKEGLQWLIRAARQDFPWNSEAESTWRFYQIAMCCAFLFWIIIPLLGLAVAADVVHDLYSDNNPVGVVLPKMISSIFLLAGPLAYGIGIWRNLTLARWGCVLMVLSAIETSFVIAHGLAARPGTLLFNHLPIPLLLLFLLTLATIQTCRTTVNRTYWLELKRNQRQISFVLPNIVCLAAYLAFFIARHYVF